jgi:tetratricopeptide (TPR) repeat protein
LQNEQARHWLLSGLVLCALIATVAGQRYLDRVQPPYPAPPELNNDKSNAPGLLQRVARAAAVGNAYNRASDAARSGDHAALADALQDLRQLKAASRAAPLALAAAEEAVQQASIYEFQSRAFKGAQAKELLAKATARYHEALELSPVFNSNDPQLVNALGYFLADRGTTAIDFRTAERLTRRAVQQWDVQVQAAIKDKRNIAVYSFNRANTRDSLAWALYRQGRYEEALVEQRQAVIEGALAAKPAGEKMSADLYFHLGEIFRALKRWNEAREQYRLALQIEPGNTDSQQALKKLPAAPSQPKAMQKPAPTGPRLPLAPKLPPETEEDEPEVPAVPTGRPLIAQRKTQHA